MLSRRGGSAARCALAAGVDRPRSAQPGAWHWPGRLRLEESITQQCAEGLPQRAHITCRHQEARLAVYHGIGQPTGGRGDDRTPAGHRLNRRQR
jgi:hypothetical protein